MMTLQLLSKACASGGRLVALTSLLVLAGATACNADADDATPTDFGDPELATFCSSSWAGKLPYAGSQLSFRACLKEGECSSELRTRARSAPQAELSCVRVGDTPAVDCGDAMEQAEPGAFGIYGIWNPDESEAGLVDVNVVLRYPLRLSQALDDDDRATLTIKAEDGTVLVQSESAAPYELFSACKSVAPDLGGEPRL